MKKCCGMGLFLLLISTNFICAQQIEIEQFDHFEEARINTIVIDKSGKKWLGTSEGVYTVKSFDSLPNEENEVGAYSIALDKKQTVWLGLENNILLNKSDSLTFLFSKDNQDILNNIVLLPEKVVIATTKKVLSFSYEEDQYTNKNLYTSAELVKEIYDRDNGGFLRVNWIFSDKDGSLWIGSDHGLFKVNQKGKIKQLGEALQFSAFTYYAGSLWVAGIDGVWEFRNMKDWIPHPEYSSGTPHRISAMSFDQKGNLWLLSNRLIMCGNGDCSEFSTTQGFASKHGLCMVVDKDNSIWVGTEGKGLFRASYVEEEEEVIEEIEEIVEVEKEVLIETKKQIQAETVTTAALSPEELELKKRYDYMAGADYTNLVLLIDVSSSMAQEEKYPRLNESVQSILRRMRPEDKVSIITFSQWPTIVLEPTSCTNNEKIESLLDSLVIKGVSNVDRGLIRAAEFMSEVQLPNGNNRIILATDGMFQVDKATFEAIKESRKRGVSLTVFDFGRSENQQLEKLAEKGGGNYQLIPKNTTSLISVLEKQIKKQN